MATPQRRKRTKSIVETEEYVAFLHRVIAALAARLADDPAGLVHVEALRDQLRDAANIAIAVNQERPGPAGYSYAELAKILGISREAIFQRAAKGRALLAAERERLGVVSLRERRQARLDRAGLPDRRAANR
ncbi:hypothetical protein [Thermoactinospora rubra]|uniref:hypothetical protein n=1 Tax=Thermoactinospora rubra TaxID=1088767 RepID=UPI00117E2D23|nr:hypothetical protein [Thermoactinospora rubra]